MSFTVPMLEAARTAVVGATRFYLGDVAKKRYPTVDIESAIGTPLSSAIRCYTSGEQLACVRHLMIALMHTCTLIGWKDAAAYLNEQQVCLSQKLQGNES